VETDYLTGEIALLGRIHGVPTPVNDLLQKLTWEAANRGDPPGNLTVEDVKARLNARR
jgi:2-dehydropantoate 2-reductase